jgi:hypothetical protein
MRQQSIQHPLYYETHITIEPVFDGELDRLRQACTPYAFRTSEFLLEKRPVDTPDRSRYDAFCNGRSHAASELERRTLACRAALEAAGFRVWRHKLEATLIDSRYDGAILFPLDRGRLPERELRPKPAVSLEEAAAAAEPLPDAVRYYESHVTVEPLTGGRLEEYRRQCGRHGFKPAGILAKTRNADPARPHGRDTFCTGHGKTDGELQARMLRLLAGLQEAGIAIWRYRLEAVVLDMRAKH